MTPPFLTTRQITPRVQACPFLLFSNYSQCIKAFYTIQKPAYKSIQFYLLNIKILEDSKRKINLCTSVTPQLGELNFQICFQSALMLPAAFTFVFGVWGGISFLLWQRSLFYPEASSPYLWVCIFVSCSYNKQLWMFEKLITTGKKQKLASRFYIYNAQNSWKHITISINILEDLFPPPLTPNLISLQN